MARIQRVIIRSKKDAAISMELQLNIEDETISIIANRGLEILLIDKAYGKDVEMKRIDDISITKEFPPTKPTNEENKL